MASDPADLPPSDDTNDFEGRLADLLAEYLERHAAGENITEEVVRSEHPDEAAQLLPELRALHALSSGSRDSPVPRHLGDYRLVRRIGRGGMGVVYEAVQESMERRVALKVLPSGVLGDSRNLSRFIREAKIAGQLHHPNIVPVHALGAEADSPYYAMEYVEGETLASVVSRLRKSRDKPEAERSRVLSGVLRRFGSMGRDEKSSEVFSNEDSTAAVTTLDTEEVTPAFGYRLAESFAAVAEGLQHAHARGIIHRDLKPSNLMLDRDGRLRILDFGLARREGQEGLTLSGDLIGTVLYMSPEQAKARQEGVDHLTDIYSLGATLYELLAWRPPFEGRDYHDTLSQIVSKEPRPLRSVNHRIPADLETIVAKCMRKQPTERYRTAEALAQDLRRFVRGDPVEARPLTPLERLGRNVRKHRGKAVVAAVVVALVVSVAWIAIKAQRDDRLRRETEYAPKVLGALRLMRLSQMSGRDSRHYKLGLYPWGFRVVRPGISTELLREGGLRPLREAADELSAAVASLPGRVDAYWHRARVRILLGDEQGALHDLEAATRLAPELVPALLLRASILERRGQADRAARLERRANELARDGWARAWLAGQRASRNRDWKKAADAFGDSTRLLAGNDEPWVGFWLEIHLARGVMLLMDDRPVDAMRELAIIRYRWPEAVDVALLEAAAFWSHGEGDYPTRAEEQFEKLYRESEYPGETALAVKAMYFVADHAPRFSRIPAKWIERVPSPVREIVHAWDICMENRRHCDKAADLIEKAIEPGTNNATLLREIGRAYNAFGKPDAAVRVLRRSIVLEPDSGIGRVRLGQVLARRKAAGDEIEALELAGDVELDHPELSAEVGRIYFVLGRLKDALRLYDRALELDLGSPVTSKNMRATILARLAEKSEGAARRRLYEEALAGHDEAIARNPRRAIYHRKRGEILLALGRSLEAFRAFVDGIEVEAADRDCHERIRSMLSRHPRPNLEDGPRRLVIVLEGALDEIDTGDEDKSGSRASILETLDAARSWLKKAASP